MYRNIVFDLDGTLTDSGRGILASVTYALEKLGAPVPAPKTLRLFVGPPLTGSFMKYCGMTEAQAAEGVRLFRERYVPIGVYESAVFPEIRGLLEALRKGGKQVGVATSKPESLACQLLEREGMLSLFDVVAGAGDNGAGNAKWQVIGRAMEALGAPREDTVLIGDTKYDVAGAHQVGIPCIGVEYGYAAPGELEAAGADAIVPDCAALQRLLLSEN